MPQAAWQRWGQDEFEKRPYKFEVQELSLNLIHLTYILLHTYVYMYIYSIRFVVICGDVYIAVYCMYNVFLEVVCRYGRWSWPAVLRTCRNA